MKKRQFLKTSAMATATMGGVGLFDRVSAAQTEESEPYIRPPGALPEDEFLNRCIRCFRCGEACPKTAIKFAGPDLSEKVAGEEHYHENETEDENGDGTEHSVDAAPEEFVTKAGFGELLPSLPLHGTPPTPGSLDKFSIVSEYRKRETHPAKAYDTPYLEVWDTECILCMQCTEACPTGALQETPVDKDVVQEHVDMGTAKVDKELCFAWNAWAQWNPDQDEFERIEGYPGFVCGLCYNQCPYRGEAIEVDSMNRPIINEESCVGCGVCERTCPAGNGSSGDPTQLLHEVLDERDDLKPPAMKVVPNEDRPKYARSIDRTGAGSESDDSDSDKPTAGGGDANAQKSGWLN